MKRAATLILSLLLLSPYASAKVVGCLLDGGGTPEERYCGGDRAAEQIANNYKASKVQAQFQVLSGPGGKKRDPECFAGVAHCVKDDPNCAELEASHKLQWNRKTEEWNSQVQSVSSRNSFGKMEPPFSASEDSFNKNCLFDSDRTPKDPNKIDVCQFWSVNHGSPKGVVFYNPGAKDDDHFLDSEKLSRKADGCKTFRFVTNSCYGGQLSKLIFDKDGRVIPGRCGISAAPPNYVAIGVGSPEPGGPIEFKNQVSPDRLAGADKTQKSGKTSLGKILGTYYPLLHPGEDAGASPTLDRLSRIGSGDPIKTGEVESTLEAGFQPYRTSDFFLETTLKNNRTVIQSGTASSIVDPENERVKLIREAIAPHQAVMDGAMSCIDKDNFAGAIRILHKHITPIVSDGRDDLSAQEREHLKSDLQDEVISLRLDRDQMCATVNVLKVKCSNERSPDCVSQGLRAMMNRSCDSEEVISRYAAERQEHLLAYNERDRRATELRDRMEGLCGEFGVSVAECPNFSQIARKLQEIIRRRSDQCRGLGQAVLSSDPSKPFPDVCPGTAMGKMIEKANLLKRLKPESVKAERALAQKAKELDQFIKDNEHIRRYEDSKFRFAQVLELYKKGTPQKIREYLTLRACERGDFNKVVTSAK
jgi:hypothetical protein